MRFWRGDTGVGEKRGPNFDVMWHCIYWGQQLPRVIKTK